MQDIVIIMPIQSHLDCRAVEMDFFDSRYYRINKLALSFLGLWPYQRANIRTYTTSFTIFGLINLCIPQVIYIVKYLNDLDSLLGCMPSSVGGLIVTTKVLTLMHKSAVMKDLLDQMHEDWNSITSIVEEEILRKYAETGRKFTLGYAFIVLPPVVVYVLLPLNAPILDIIFPLNESRKRMLPNPGEYFIDQDRYYYFLMISQCYAYVIAILVGFGTDSMYIVFIQHGCGMFSILRFTELIASGFTTFLLFDVGLGIVLHSTSCVMIVIRSGQVSDALHFAGLAAAQSVRLFLNSWPGQNLIDHSAHVSVAAYDGQWYNMPVKARRLLLLLMMKSQSACSLIIAGFYVINLDSFGTVMKTSISYCTIMASLHDASNQ